MNTVHASLLVLLCLAGAAGCQGARPTSGNSADRLSVERLYPLRAGSVWTYDVDTGEGAPTLAITRVISSADKQADVSSGGAPIHYEQRADGLYRTDREVYVLKLPLRVGATWDAGQGATAEVTDLDKRVSTVAGEFSGCVEVRERAGEGQKQVRTVFCPDVGPVELESTLQLAITGRGARVLARLRGYDFSGALGSL